MLLRQMRAGSPEALALLDRSTRFEDGVDDAVAAILRDIRTRGDEAVAEYTRRFDKEIRASGAKTALYMVWPSEARFKDFERVIESYRLAADEVKAMLFPVGRAWREAWKRDAKMALYSGDRFHPSVAGSYLAALVIYEKLFERSSIGLPANLRPRSRAIDRIDLSKEQADLLQAAAAEANKI